MVCREFIAIRDIVVTVLTLLLLTSTKKENEFYITRPD